MIIPLNFIHFAVEYQKPNEFCYKFSWSPLGVLKALKSPAKSIEEFNPVETLRPWHNVYMKFHLLKREI